MEIQPEFKVTGAGAPRASANWGPGGLPVCRNGGRGPAGIRQLGSGGPRPGNGRSFSKRTASSRRPFGEVGLFIFNIVLLDGKICSERMKLNQKSSLETHFEATVTRFEVSSEFGRKSKVKRSGPGRVASMAAREARGPTVAKAAKAVF